jgi:hypothetical protein
MAKPHEETWGVTYGKTVENGKYTNGSWLLEIEDGADPAAIGEMWSEAHAKLAAQAPAMARLLVDILKATKAERAIGNPCYTDDDEIAAVLRAAGAL